MPFDPTVDDFDPELINEDEFGLEDKDRKALSDILLSKGPRAAREPLERHFGASFADIQREVEESKRYEARVEKMTEALTRFQLHYTLWLNTERNQNTLLSFLKPELGEVFDGLRLEEFIRENRAILSPDASRDDVNVKLDVRAKNVAVLFDFPTCPQISNRRIPKSC
jgi:hypothetical protein